MIRVPDHTWDEFLNYSYNSILSFKSISFTKLKPGDIPKNGGVYLICTNNEFDELPFYIGTTSNLRQRIYLNHLMGDLVGSSFKKYLIKNNFVKDKEEAKIFMRKNCTIRWIEEKDKSIRGALEGYFTGRFMPLFGFESEH